MKTRFKIISIFLILYFPVQATAQNIVKQHKYLTIGDTVPDIAFRIYHYKSPTVKISEFKGKLVILDIWSVTCSACIAAMPEMQELQKKFPNKLQIIMVTKDSPDLVAKRALHADNIRNNKLPSIMGDSLASLFDYTFMPTHVWIDKTGVIRYITSEVSTTAKNITQFLNGKDIKLPEKIDLTIDRSKPLLVSWYPYYKGISIYTYLTPVQTQYHAGSMFGIDYNKNGLIKRVSIDQGYLAELYELAFGIRNILNFGKNRIIFNLKRKDSLLYKTLYTFDLINNNKVPNARLYKYMQDLLDMSFGVKSSWQKRKVDCYVLRKLPGQDKLSTKGGRYVGNWVGNTFTIRNLTWSRFIRIISVQGNTPLQIIDKTGVNPQSKVDVSINLDWQNLDIVNNSLRPYGLFVKKQKRRLSCIVINGL